MVNIVDQISRENMKAKVDFFEVGDTVDVYVRISEGDKKRLQRFGGIVIAKRGSGINESFTVRRYANNEGVERTFPLHSPNVDRVEVKNHGKVRRAKLYYLRDKIGKQRRLAERKGTRKPPKMIQAAPAPTPAASAETAESTPEETNKSKNTE